jgi:hypothetical protein
LATLIIVAVVIIMAELTVEVKASPVFDRANLKEECHIHLEEARWNRYSKARRCGSEWSGILEAAVDPVYFSRAPWTVTTIWLSAASIWGEASCARVKGAPEQSAARPSPERVANPPLATTG